MLKLLDEKWGDLVGLFLIIGGAALSVWAPSCRNLGESAFVAGMALLKLQGRKDAQ
jgi:hypothetical protein